MTAWLRICLPGRTCISGVLTLIAVSLSLVVAQPCPVIWGPTQQISNTQYSAYGASGSLAAVGDTVHTVYLAGDLYYRRSLDGGATWGQQLLIVPDDSMSPQLWNRPLAASGRNIYVVWGNSMGAEIGSIKVRRSNDGGASWFEPQVLVRSPSPSSSYYLAPVVTAFGENVFVAIGHNQVHQVFFTRSTDSGATWELVHQITSESHGQVAGDIIATSVGVHAVGWRGDQPSGSEIGYLGSTDGGITWSASNLLSAVDNYRSWEPHVSTDDAGNVYCCWLDAKYGSIGGFAGTVLLRKSTENGSTWLPEQRISSLPSADHSSMSVSEADVHIVWDDERNGVGNGTIQYAFSSDGGRSWCDDITVGDTLDVNIDASVAATGNRVHVAWSSYRDSPPYGPANVYYRSGSVNATSVNPPQETTEGERPWLGENYPNPFNKQTIIRYTIVHTTQIRLSAYDILGREVSLLQNGFQPPGSYMLKLDGQHLSTGMYLLVLQTSQRREVKKILVVK